MRTLIGERLQYELLLNLPAGGYGINFKFPDSIPHFDVLENKDYDTVNNNGSLLIRKKITFTSFDSGTWHIPSFEVLLEKNRFSSKLLTDSVIINVGYAPADNTNQLRDIKTVIDVPVKDYFWYYMAAATLLLLIILGLLYWFLKNKEKKPLPVFHASLSPYEEAMKALQELKEKEYDHVSPGQIKIHYVSLSSIFKKYYSRKLSMNLMNKTTGEILLGVKEQWSDPVLLSTLAAALRCSDAVKFARYIPGISEFGENLQQIEQSIERIELISVPEKK